MATALDNVIGPLAKSLIAQFGMTVTVVDPGRTYVPGTGDATASAVTYTGQKMTPPTSGKLQSGPVGDSFLDNSTIKQGDARAFLAAKDLTFTPDTGFKVTIDSQTWHVISVGKVYSGDDIAIWEVGLRK